MSPTPRRGRRQTVARHGQLRSPHPVSQFFKILAVSLAVVLVAGLGVVGYNTWNLFSTLSSNAVELEGQTAAPPSIGELEGGFNLLLVGTDACEEEYAHYFPGRCSGKDADGELNDVNILLHVSDNPRRVTAISFPRDLMLPIPACTSENGSTSSAMSKQPLNDAYGYGGLSCVAKTISQLTGENVDYAAKITWGGVIEVTNAIGGVEVCVANGIYDPIYTGLDLEPGMHTLQGIEALEFLRTRHGVGDGSDLGRISNQQQFLSSMVRKLQSDEVLSNPSTLFGLANTAVQQVSNKQLVLSESLSNPTRMVQIAMAVKNVDYDDIVFLQYPTAYEQGKGSSKVVPRTGPAKVLFQALTENKAIRLTGKASQGFGVEVEGEATKPSATPTPGASGTPTTPPTADPDADAVDLPSAIAGQTAAQVTCTRPER